MFTDFVKHPVDPDQHVTYHCLRELLQNDQNAISEKLKRKFRLCLLTYSIQKHSYINRNKEVSKYINRSTF